MDHTGKIDEYCLVCGALLTDRVIFGIFFLDNILCRSNVVVKTMGEGV